MIKHQKKCGVNNPQIIKFLLEKVANLEEQLNNQGPSVTVNNNTLNHINVQNNNLYLNVTICSFGNEDLSKLDTAKVMQLLKNHTDNFMPKMIEHVHANPDHPEFHNVFYDPQREKAIVFAQISDTEMSWQARDFQEVSTDLTEKIKEHIRPGSGPYFDQAARVKDYDTSNKIIQIVDTSNWSAEEIKEMEIIKNYFFLFFSFGPFVLFWKLRYFFNILIGRIFKIPHWNLIMFSLLILLAPLILALRRRLSILVSACFLTYSSI